jgi:hypothetical protein
MLTGRTDVGLAKEASALGRGRRRRGALNLRRRWRARLAHAVRSVHRGVGVLVIYQVQVGRMWSCLEVSSGVVLIWKAQRRRV